MSGWTKDLLNPPGLVGEVVDWIRASSGMEQPKFALAAGLTLCGSLLGRGVKDYTGQRTNLYALAIGHTSAGKNAPIQAIQAALAANPCSCADTPATSETTPLTTSTKPGAL